MRTVLLVDDSKLQRLGIRSALETDGYLVREAEDGESAEEILETDTSIDVILLDWQLPGRCGLELTRLWSNHDQWRWIPIVMITSRDDPGAVVESLAAGAIDFIRKPPAQLDLVARLSCAIRVRDLQLELLKASVTDPLTQLANRRRADEILGLELTRALRYGHPFALAILDLDYFKRVNDTLGHGVGDEVLQVFANLLVAELRTCDFVARIGGEEFVVLLPETPLCDAPVPLNRVLNKMGLVSNVIAKHAGNQAWTTSFSAGVVGFPEHRAKTGVSGMLAMADDALYQAKEEGRGRVVLASVG